LAQSLYFCGTFLIAPFIGFVADWFGRKRACIIFLTPISLMYFASYFTENMYIWLTIRFALGVFVMGFAMSRSVFMVSQENYELKGFFKIPHFLCLLTKKG